MVDLLEGIFGLLFVLAVVALYLAFIGWVLWLMLRFAERLFNDDDWEDEEHE